MHVYIGMYRGGGGVVVICVGTCMHVVRWCKDVYTCNCVNPLLTPSPLYICTCI